MGIAQKNNAQLYEHNGLTPNYKWYYKSCRTCLTNCIGSISCHYIVIYSLGVGTQTHTHTHVHAHACTHTQTIKYNVAIRMFNNMAQVSFAEILIPVS